MIHELKVLSVSEELEFQTNIHDFITEAQVIQMVGVVYWQKLSLNLAFTFLLSSNTLSSVRDGYMHIFILISVIHDSLFFPLMNHVRDLPCMNLSKRAS